MLSKIFSKTKCASCKFCCSFRRTSIWETPLFSNESMDSIERRLGFQGFQKETRNHIVFGRYDLRPYYKTDDPAEEVLCPFLKDGIGCILSQDEKPLECKLWPYRILRDQDKYVLAVDLDCPQVDRNTLYKDFAKDELLPHCRKWIQDYPYMIKDMTEGYVVLFPIE